MRGICFRGHHAIFLENMQGWKSPKSPSEVEEEIVEQSRREMSKNATESKGIKGNAKEYFPRHFKPDRNGYLCPVCMVAMVRHQMH